VSDTPVYRGKVVMIGAPGVGKSSLVRRFVHSIFSDEYRSTLGVKVDRKTIVTPQWSMAMVLWDMHGETEGLEVPTTYLRGVTGALVVMDATRPETAVTAADLCARVQVVSPRSEVLCIANKSDLGVEWESANAGAEQIAAGEPVRTSAKTGDGVEDAFKELARQIIERSAS